MNSRWFAVIAETLEPPRVKHYQGFPPELAQGRDERTQLPRARVTVLEEAPEGIFLYRWAADGAFGGDTWHANLDDAKHQASYEFGGSLGEWKEVPGEVADATAFALSHLS